MRNDYLGKEHYTLDTLVKLAKGLEVDVADLLKKDLFQSKWNDGQSWKNHQGLLMVFPFSIEC